MNYQKIYNNLTSKSSDASYTEVHHIIPKCMGGNDDPSNLVRLTPEAHYVAHQLLVKIYPDNHKLIFAAHMMNNGRTSNKLYGWLKRKASKATSERKVSAETRAKMSAAQKGKPSPKKGKSGKKASTETKSKISDAKKGNTYRKGIPHSIETRNKMSIERKGKSKSISTCPHCNKTGGSNGLKRYHFENCRFKEINKLNNDMTKTHMDN